MRLKVKDLDISTGGIFVVLLNEDDARKYDLRPGDRVKVQAKKSTRAVIDVTTNSRVIPIGRVGAFEEVLTSIGAHHGDEIRITLDAKPTSLVEIKKKLDGQELAAKEIKHIINDIVLNKLTDIELTYFVSAGYIHGFTKKETAALTKAMMEFGDVLKLGKKQIFDKHCIGGVAGNRTTMVVVPILAAAGLCIPKTSSRSITSPAGTADTMEVLANVSLNKKQIERVVKKTGACMVWGGGVSLAPADDRIIQVEHPLGIDSEGQLLASVMAKKASVGATNFLIDIPVGSGAKIEDKKEASVLAKKFKDLGKTLGMRVDVVQTDGSKPIGKGVGPALEARDVLYVLMNDGRQPDDLRKKSIDMATRILSQKMDSKKARIKVKKILESGKAYKKMVEIIKAQGKKITKPEQIILPSKVSDHLALKSGTIKGLDNKIISKVARIAGAPDNPGAGIYIHRNVGDKVKKEDVLFTIYSQSDQRLRYAIEYLQLHEPCLIQR